jgi:pimeloyl-ACP methyl ester carboxylesterase
VARGIIVLHPDKRGSGESSGNWRLSSIQDFAADVKAGVAFLRRQPGVDPTAIGIIGYSQGGYVASVVAAEDTPVRFTAVISGGTASLRSQIVDELLIEAERRDQPLAEPAANMVHDVYRRLFDAATNPERWGSYTRAATAAQAQDGPLAHALRTVPLDSTHWVVGYLATMGDFHPMPYWDRVSSPAVFIYGAEDSQIRVDASVGRLRASPARAHFTTTVLGSNGHAHFLEDIVAFLAQWFHMRGTDK